MEDEFILQEDTEMVPRVSDEMDPTSEMSDDDIAAALGFATTMGEQVMPQDDMPEEEGMEEANMEEEAPGMGEEVVEEPVAGVEEVIETPTQDDVQDQEIKAIRMELERLKGELEDEEDGETEEDTGTTEETG